jgi:hypothetical protein
VHSSEQTGRKVAIAAVAQDAHHAALFALAQHALALAPCGPDGTARRDSHQNTARLRQIPRLDFGVVLADVDQLVDMRGK